MEHCRCRDTRASFVLLYSLGCTTCFIEEAIMFRIAISTFLLVFLAELGDKTQLAVFTMALEYRSPWSVFFGAGSVREV